MVFNWKVFWTRAFTALIFVAIMLSGLLYSDWSFFVLISVIHFGCWWEYIGLVEKIHKTSFHIYTRLGFCLIGYHLVLFFCAQLALGSYTIKNNFSLPILIAGFILLIAGLFQQQRINLKAIGATALGFIYLSLSLGLLLYLRYTITDFILKNAETEGKAFATFYIPLLIIVAIWINDTMAYLVGSMIGRTPFSKISPKKTIEGTIGGMLCCVLAITIILNPWFKWPYLAGISLVVAIAGTIGDLLESKIKRMAGVKDSGHMMPGHGGFLDRFDSLLFAVPFVWLLLQLF